MLLFVLKRPLSTRSHRSSSIATDGIGNTPSSNQDIIPIVSCYIV
jgi:hypothetical protein